MAESLADTLQMYELIYKILPLTNFSYAGNFIAAALCPLSSEGSFLAALQQLFVSLALWGQNLAPYCRCSLTSAEQSRRTESLNLLATLCARPGKHQPSAWERSDTHLNHGNKRHDLLHVLLQLWQGTELTGNHLVVWQPTSSDLNNDDIH